MFVGRKIGAIFSYILMTVEVVSSLLFTPFLIRVLGQAEFGVYSLSLSITSYFTLLDLGVGNAMVRYLAKYRAEGDLKSQEKFLGLAFLFYLAVCVVMAALFIPFEQSFATMFGNGLSTEEIGLAQSLLRVTIINAGITMIVSIFDKVLIAYELFALSKTIQIAKLVVRVAMQFALLALGFRSMGIVVSNLVLTIIAGAVTFAIVAGKLRLIPTFKGLDLSFVKEIIAYTSFVFLQMIATQINSMAGQVILGMTTSAVILGIYAVGTQIHQYFQSIASGINGVTMPGIVALWGAGAPKQEIELEMIKVGRLSLLVIGIIMGGFLAVGDSFVSLWAGQENADAYGVAVLLMLPMTLALAQSAGSQVLWAMGRHQLQAVIKLLASIGNILMTFALVSWNPLIGAALSSSLSCFIGDIVAMNAVFKREIKINLVNYYKGLLKGIAPSVMVASVSAWLLKYLLPFGWASLVVEIVVALIVYALCLYQFGFNEYEKSLVGSIMERAFK